MSEQSPPSHPDEQPDDFERRLRLQLYRWDCPDPDTLGDYFLGQLPEHQTGPIRAHVQDCVRCQQEIRLLESFLNQADAPAPSQSVYKSPAQQQSALIPVVQFARPTQEYGLRGTGNREAKLSFDLELSDGVNEKVELLLTINSQPDTQQLNGLLSMSEAAESLLIDGLVEIWQTDQLLATVFIDDLGNFTAELPTLAPILLRITIKGRTLFTGQVEFE